jgi:hypothetical protein
MKKILTAACGTCAIASLAVTAHTAQPRQPSSRTRTVTVTGCLSAWPAPAETGPEGGAADAAVPVRFILSKVASGEIGVPTTRRYTLVAGPSVELDTLVDRRIEVTGTLAVASESQRAWTKATAEGTASGRAGEPVTLIPMLRARSVRTLAGSCP